MINSSYDPFKRGELSLEECVQNVAFEMKDENLPEWMLKMIRQQLCLIKGS